MTTPSKSIEALLTLDATSFHTGINTATESVKRLTDTINSSGKNFNTFANYVTEFDDKLRDIANSMARFNSALGDMKNLKDLGQFLKNTATSIKILSSDIVDLETGMTAINNIFKAWGDTVGNVTVKVENVTKVVRQLSGESKKSGYDVKSTFDMMSKGLLLLSQNILRTGKVMTDSEARAILQAEKMKDEFRGAYQELMNFANGGVQAFNRIKTGVNSVNTTMQRSVSTFNSYRVALQGINSSTTQLSTATTQLNGTTSLGTQRQHNMGTALNNTTANVRTQTSAIEGLQVSVNGLDASESKLEAKEREVASATNQTSSSIQRQSATMGQASARANEMASATNRLGRAMSSLRMMGTMVGSMLVYNFAHNLITATRETVNAKSEMNGYFQMLGYTTGQVEDFNKELDKTVKKFPRLNKYNLGETISSIGVEFELTTEEMKKAMPVVSMITSEYLRAGRNVDEASLAVKDILQGEFQRLSRETGVKGDQLKEAGWSGDKNDVMGLLKALDKVGKSRNWDVFVSKANSLNDAVLILQNRFGEWSADMVERFQPAILGVFNMAMDTAQKFANFITGAMDWLSGDGIENQIGKWTLLATTIGTVVTALISYRTGATLLQIAQMGLSKSILATILGLKGEAVAYYGVRTAIFSKIFGLNAEKVAELTTKQAIASKVLGLDAELVAQRGIKQGILDSAFARELEALRIKGATSEEMLNTLAIYENKLAQKSGIGVLTAYALKLDMSTYGTHGFTVALLESRTALKGTQIATMNLAQKFVLLTASMVVPTAIVGAFAVAVGSLIIQMRDGAKAMEKFNDLAENGQDIIKDAKETLNGYKSEQESLKQQLAETTEGTQEYYDIQTKLRGVNQDIITSQQNLENTTKAVEVAVSSQKNYEIALTDIATDKQERLAQAYMDAGYSMHEAYEMANDSLIDANKGAEQLRIALQKIAKLSYKGEQNISDLLSKFDEYDVDKDVGKTYLVEAERLNKMAKDGMEKGLTDDSFMGRMDGWLSYYEAQVRIWLNNVGAMFETGDWGSIWDNIWKGIAHGFADLPIVKDFWGWIYDQLGVDRYKGQGWDAFKNIGWDMVKGIFDIDLSSVDFGTDPVRWIGDWFANSLAGISDYITENVSPILIDAFTYVLSLQWMSDIQAHLGNVWNEMFAPLINGITVEFPNYLYASLGRWSEIFGNLYNIITGAFWDTYNNVKKTIQDIITNATTGFGEVYTNSIGSVIHLRDSVSNAIDKVMDAFREMKDTILDCAKKIKDGVKEKFDSVKNTIGGFYDKLTHPDKWFSGSSGLQSYSRQPKPLRARRMFSPSRRTGGKHGAGVNPYQSRQVTLNDIVAQLGGDKRVDLASFLSLFANSGFGGWDYAETHKTHIFNTGKEWRADSPSFKGHTLGDGFPVKRFWDGKPQGFKWSEFMSVATAIFSAIPYKFYMDSDWKGNWVSALLSGATNCYDGSMALVSLAKLFGFEGDLIHTNLKSGMGHFYARINGHNLDTTNFQHHGSWTPLGGAGIPTRSGVPHGAGQTQSKNVQVTVNINGDVYDGDDLESRIADGVDKGLAKYVNDPYTVAI